MWNTPENRKELHMERANPTEEGLASLNTVILREEPSLIRAALLYYTVSKAMRLSFCDLFEDLGKYVSDPDIRWDYCLRAKRGFTDTSKPGGKQIYWCHLCTIQVQFCHFSCFEPKQANCLSGAFHKDEVYLRGMLGILKNRHFIDFNLLFRLGKVSIRDLERLQDSANLEGTKVPKFVQNEEKYRLCMEKVITKNGLTDEDLQDFWGEKFLIAILLDASPKNCWQNTRFLWHCPKYQLIIASPFWRHSSSRGQNRRQLTNIVFHLNGNFTSKRLFSEQELGTDVIFYLPFAFIAYVQAWHGKFPSP